MRTLARYDWSKTHVLSEYKPAILYCSSTKPWDPVIVACLVGDAVDISIVSLPARKQKQQ